MFQMGSPVFAVSGRKALAGLSLRGARQRHVLERSFSKNGALSPINRGLQRDSLEKTGLVARFLKHHPRVSWNALQKSAPTIDLRRLGAAQVILAPGGRA